MQRKQIGVMDFHGSVDITDPCYEKEVWCRMNGVKIKAGTYACMVWHHTEKKRTAMGVRTPVSWSGSLASIWMASSRVSEP